MILKISLSTLVIAFYTMLMEFKEGEVSERYKVQDLTYKTATDKGPLKSSESINRENDIWFDKWVKERIDVFNPDKTNKC